MIPSSDQRRGSRSSQSSISKRKSTPAAEESLTGWSDVTYLCEKPDLAIAEVKQCNFLMGRVHNVASVTIKSLNSLITTLKTLLANERKNGPVEEPASFTAMLDLLEEFVVQSSSLSTNIEQRMLPLTASWVSLQTSMVSYDAALAAHADRTRRHHAFIDQQRKKCKDLLQLMNGSTKGPGLANLLQRRTGRNQGSKLARIDKTYRACLEYEFRLSTARTDMRLWRFTEIPGILAALQEIHERRLQSIDAACQTIMDALVPYTRGFRVQLPPTAKFGRKFIAESIRTSKAMQDSASSSAQYVYDLSVTLSDLTERRRMSIFSEQGSHHSDQFTLSEMVLKQYSAHPAVEVPILFHRLMEGINKLDPNVSLDGAFRTTPRLSELDDFREFVLSDRWTSDISPEMVNLYAYQLKCWLRELPYPVIPAELYIRCIELGRGPIGKNEQLEDELKKIIQSLPSVNAFMIKTLVLLLRRCINSNPVSGETLITVFAPCIMRNPVDNDPSRMLADLAAERQFLSSLINFWVIGSDK